MTIYEAKFTNLMTGSNTTIPMYMYPQMFDTKKDMYMTLMINVCDHIKNNPDDVLDAIELICM